MPRGFLRRNAFAALFCASAFLSCAKNGAASLAKNPGASGRAERPSDGSAINENASSKTASDSKAENAAARSFESAPIPTWESSGGSEPPLVFNPRVESLPPDGALVWAGTASHHLLAGRQIDFWFKEIARRRNVQTFFIISPSHYGLSTKPWSLDDRAWKTKGGLVKTNSKIEKALAARLGVSYDKQVFFGEHGISTLIPYIKKYFPAATVCALAVNGEPPMNQADAQRLSDALAPFFAPKEREKNFLLVSTDFSHGGNAARTQERDERSRTFFDAPSEQNWILCGCDNRPGIYVLSRLPGADAFSLGQAQKKSAVQNKAAAKKTKCVVLFHSNSCELSGIGADDITSYFFTLFYDAE